MTDETLSAQRMPETGDPFPHLEAGTVAAYIDNRLPPAQAVSVESHLADCEKCRAEIIQLNGILRPRRPRRRVYFAALAVAAAVLLLFALPGTLGIPGGPTGPAQADSLAFRIREMGAVAQPPIYLGVSVRAPSERGMELFTTGMRAYTAARYQDAVTALRGAGTAGIDGAATPFFLGASLLMLGDATGAAAEFARVISMGETPYLAEAHYYRAKALLLLNRPSDAMAELDRSAQSGAEPISSAARSLRDSVRVLRER